jgi:uncharacterized protein (TIGR02421 family)
MATTEPNIDEALITTVRERLATNRRVRRTLPGGGRLNIDRQLPFLVVHRLRQPDSTSDLSRFIRGEASYLVAPAAPKYRRQVTALVEAIGAEMVELFGGFGIIELWAEALPDPADSPDLGPAPHFSIALPKALVGAPSVVALEAALRKISIAGRAAEVAYDIGRTSPPGLPRLTATAGRSASRTAWVGLEVRPIHRDAATGAEYPDVARRMHQQISRAMQRTAFEFARRQTTQRPRHYQALGRRAFVKAARRADRQLSSIATAFDLLLLVSPVNTDREYRRFIKNGGSRTPRFEYRPIDVDPSLLKRSLYATPVERVEDPTLEALFREKQRELSLKLDLLADRGTPRFLHTGVALYGEIDRSTLDTALDLLGKLDAERDDRPKRAVPAAEVARRAAAEIDHYRSVMPEMTATVTVRDDLSSLMVSDGHVLVGSSVRVPSDRVNALIQHEVGTHVVTFWNGSIQPLTLLSTGLAGHDELQEGFAVLAEHLVGGLTRARLRTLAGRVIAADTILDGAEFVDTYRTLTDDHGFLQRTSFQISARVHRGGGLVKDAVYLRGLQKVVAYLADGGRLDTLLVGKISVEHAAVIEELQRRGVLRTPPLRPAYLDDPDTFYRLENLRGSPELHTLVEHV